MTASSRLPSSWVFIASALPFALGAGWVLSRALEAWRAGDGETAQSLGIVGAFLAVIAGVFLLLAAAIGWAAREQKEIDRLRS
jgi:hypothetical protein